MNTQPATLPAAPPVIPDYFYLNFCREMQGKAATALMGACAETVAKKLAKGIHLKPLLILLFAVLVQMLAGCASDKPSPSVFLPQQPSSTNVAVVYVYRPMKESVGHQQWYPLETNGTRIGFVEYLKYYRFEAPPGHLVVSSYMVPIATNSPSPAGSIAVGSTFGGLLGGLNAAAANKQVHQAGYEIELDVQAEKFYYIKLHPDVHWMHNSPHFYLVSPDAAKMEMKSCNGDVLMSTNSKVRLF